MPESAPEGKEKIKEWFLNHSDIKTIVDFGVGVGTYRDLLGDQYHWIGIEGFEPYIEQYDLKSKYNEIINKDLKDIEFPSGDCAIFGDVLEHLNEDEMRTVLQKAKDTYKHIIVSVPLGCWPQGAVNGNEMECHRMEFTENKFNETFGDFSIRFQEGQIGIAIKCA